MAASSTPRSRASGPLPRWRSNASGRSQRLKHILEIAQARARRVDQHRHIAGLVLVGAHQFVGIGNLLPRKNVAHARIDALIEHELIGGAGLLEVREMRALHALLAHPDITRVERDVVAGGAGAEHDHAAALDDEAPHRTRLLAGMLEHDVDVALAGDVPDRLAEAPRLFHPGVVFRRADLGHGAPAFELTAVDHALGAAIGDIFGLRLARHDADSVGTGRGDKLYAEAAEAAGSPPHQ